MWGEVAGNGWSSNHSYFFIDVNEKCENNGRNDQKERNAWATESKVVPIHTSFFQHTHWYARFWKVTVLQNDLHKESSKFRQVRDNTNVTPVLSLCMTCPHLLSMQLIYWVTHQLQRSSSFWDHSDIYSGINGRTKCILTFKRS